VLTLLGIKGTKQNWTSCMNYEPLRKALSND
jgi:hypothetical protein